MLLTGVAPGKDIGLIGRAVEVAIEQIEGKEFEPGVERTPPRFTRRETTILGFAG